VSCYPVIVGIDRTFIMLHEVEGAHGREESPSTAAVHV
jgi:hypothetical protein